MFPIWLILGSVIILMGVFDRQTLRLLGLKPMSEVLSSAKLKHSSRIIGHLGRWLVITLGVNFLVHGLGELLPIDISKKISVMLLGLSGLMFLTMIGLTMANWKVK